MDLKSANELDDILVKNNPVLDQILIEEGMASEKSTLSKHRKIEKSFEDLLTGLSDENDDDIDDLVNFDHLPEMCSDSTLIAIEKTNKAYTNTLLDDSLRMSDFDHDTEHKPKPSEMKEGKTAGSDLEDDDFFSTKPISKNNDKLIDFDVETNNSEPDVSDAMGENKAEEEVMVNKFDSDVDENDTNDYGDEDHSTGSIEIGDKYEIKPSIDTSYDDKVELMVTDDCGNAVDVDDEDINELQRDNSLDLDSIVQDNVHLDVEIGKQKTALRKKGSLAKRRKPSRSSVHSMGAANEDSRFKDSTECKPMTVNGNPDEEDVFNRDSDMSSPPAKKPGMVALPVMTMPMNSKKSTSPDSDDTKKNFRNIGVKLPIPSSQGNSESDSHEEISATRLRKSSNRESVNVKEEPSHEFEKPQLKAVSMPKCDKTGSGDSKFEMPALKQVEKTPAKNKSSDRMEHEKHVFQTPKLRKVEDLPTESLKFVQGKTGVSDDTGDTDDSRHTFQTPKLKKVDNLPTQTLRHLRTDETNETEMMLDLGFHGDESSTDDHSTSYFEKPQLRNVPRPRQPSVERAKIDVPELKNVPKPEPEIKSPIETEKLFNVPQLKSVQKEKEMDNQEQDTGTFQIPSLRATPLPKSREIPKSPEVKKFDMPVLRRTPRVKPDSDVPESDKSIVGVFEKPKLKSARSLLEDMDDTTSKESKHRFDKPVLRNTPTKSDSSTQRSDYGNSEKPSWLQDRKLKPAKGSSMDTGSREKEKPSWLNDSKVLHDAKENRIGDIETVESVPRKSSIPLQETRLENLNGRTRYTSTGSDQDGEDLKVNKHSGRDQYTPSWLKTTETRGKSPSTPNLAFCTPSKDSGEIPQWKRDLAEKRRGRKDSDLGPTPRKDSSGDKEVPPWKVELGQMKMRQTPAKVNEPKVKSTEPEWKKAAEEKRQRLRNSGLLASKKT